MLLKLDFAEEEEVEYEDEEGDEDGEEDFDDSEGEAQ